MAGIYTTMEFNSAERDEDCEARDARVTIIDSSPAATREEIGSCFSKSSQSAGVEISVLCGRTRSFTIVSFSAIWRGTIQRSVGSLSLNLSAKIRETVRVVFACNETKRHV